MVYVLSVHDRKTGEWAGYYSDKTKDPITRLLKLAKHFQCERSALNYVPRVSWAEPVVRYRRTYTLKVEQARERVNWLQAS